MVGRVRHGLGTTREERAVLARLTGPERIQQFLDSIGYSADAFYRSPRAVLRDRKAHCFDGALFAAAAFAHLGRPPLLLDLRAVRDDDHVLAIFRHGRHVGAVAKSNFVGLRFREPIFRNLRELALSYFEDFYNLDGEKTLRSYSRVVDLRGFRFDWKTCDERLDAIAERLDAVRHVPLLAAAQERALCRTDERSYAAGMLGVNAAGLYRPQGARRGRRPA
jgi:hypothetical protein